MSCIAARDRVRLSDWVKGEIRVLLCEEDPGSCLDLGLLQVPGLKIHSVICDFPDTHNAFAIPYGQFMASYVKSASLYLAVGTGPVPSSYDVASPPSVVSSTRLVAELVRKPTVFSNYVDSSGDPTLSETNTVDKTFRFEKSDAVASLVEMGLFGGTDADDRNGGNMTNYKGFLAFSKPSTRVMYITWRLRFSV